MFNCKWVYTSFRMSRVSWRVLGVCIHHDIADIYVVDEVGNARRIPIDSPEAHERLGARVTWDSLPYKARVNVRAESQAECEKRYLVFVQDECERRRLARELEERISEA